MLHEVHVALGALAEEAQDEELVHTQLLGLRARARARTGGRVAVATVVFREVFVKETRPGERLCGQLAQRDWLDGGRRGRR